MTLPRPIRLNAFDMNCVAHQSPGLWRHPDDRAADYRKLSYWTDLAQLLERGRFDGLFIADVLGIYDVYGGNRDATIRQGTQVPVNDPAMLVSAMAGVTEHLGFGLTASISFEHPYPFARRMSTLDHLTDGRVGWNVVTSYLDSGARNLGESAQLTHDNRYDVADEYLEVCYKLWEGSWEDGAVLRDRESGVFTDPSKVHGIGHEGEFFKVPGIHLCEPSPQRSPVIYQAGASERGRQFAAEHAEAIFTALPTAEQLKEVVADIRGRMKAAGRDPYDARIYTLMTAIVDETREKAWAKQAEYERYASDEGALTLFSGWMGIDLSEYDLDDPIGEVESNAIQSAVRAFQQADPAGGEWKVRDIARWGGVGGRGPRLVRAAPPLAAPQQEWLEISDADGFNLAYAITPGTFVDIVDHLIPELARRGAHPTEYAEGTLRDRLFGHGPRLGTTHPGSRYRDLAGAAGALAGPAAAADGVVGLAGLSAARASSAEYTYATEELRLPAASIGALVVDSHEPSRLGLGVLLRRAPWVGRCWLGSGTEEALALARRYRPDVAILDVSEAGPRAGGRVADLRGAHPGIQVLLSSRCRKSLGAPPSALGALGFLPAGTPSEAVLAAVRAALLTGEQVEPVEPVAEEPTAPSADLGHLSERERELLVLLRTGATNREIADRIHVGPDSVKKSATALYRKLGVRNRTEAAQRAETVLGANP